MMRIGPQRMPYNYFLRNFSRVTTLSSAVADGGAGSSEGASLIALSSALTLRCASAALASWSRQLASPDPPSAPGPSRHLDSQPVIPGSDRESEQRSSPRSDRRSKLRKRTEILAATDRLGSDRRLVMAVRPNGRCPISANPPSGRRESTMRLRPGKTSSTGC